MDSKRFHLWHVWLSGSRPSAFDEELNVVTGDDALLQISLQETSINVILAAISSIHFPLDVESSEATKQIPLGVKKDFLLKILFNFVELLVDYVVII